MLDAICILALLGFLAFLIYATVISPSQRPAPPSPVRLHCSICNLPAALVDAQEYARMSTAGEFAYCEECMATIQIYERRRGRAQ